MAPGAGCKVYGITGDSSGAQGESVPVLEAEPRMFCGLRGLTRWRTLTASVSDPTATRPGHQDDR
jgi:hypothetical protein